MNKRQLPTAENGTTQQSKGTSPLGSCERNSSHRSSSTHH
jgi:hypothetical protein